jgi:hypothetical protein
MKLKAKGNSTLWNEFQGRRHGWVWIPGVFGRRFGLSASAAKHGCIHTLNPDIPAPRISARSS